jgi:dihydrofolate reductase
MGLRTWESIPAAHRPLKDRLNVVVSTSLSEEACPSGVLLARSFEDSLARISKYSERAVESIFVIGGARLYEEAFTHPRCVCVYLTRIQGSFECDVFIPPLERHPAFRLACQQVRVRSRARRVCERRCSTVVGVLVQPEVEESGVKYTVCMYARVAATSPPPPRDMGAACGASAAGDGPVEVVRSSRPTGAVADDHEEYQYLRCIR